MSDKTLRQSNLKMRVSEVYASTQGEGPNVGRTTVFVRFGGCNLRCPGWPCDTQHAIDPAYRAEWIQHTVEDLVDRTHKVADMAGAHWITLTGGEPFLQPNGSLHKFVDSLEALGYQVECFSNGTLLYPEWAATKISFIMDWKLPGSGEDPLNKNRLYNLRLLGGDLAGTNKLHVKQPQSVKFVIKDEADLQAAHGLWFDKIKGLPSPPETFYGKVWESPIQDKDLVKYVLENGLPWRLNRQVHNYVWPPNERGR